MIIVWFAALLPLALGTISSLQSTADSTTISSTSRLLSSSTSSLSSAISSSAISAVIVTPLITSSPVSQSSVAGSSLFYGQSSLDSSSSTAKQVTSTFNNSVGPATSVTHSTGISHGNSTSSVTSVAYTTGINTGNSSATATLARSITNSYISSTGSASSSARISGTNHGNSSAKAPPSHSSSVNTLASHLAANSSGGKAYTTLKTALESQKHGSQTNSSTITGLSGHGNHSITTYLNSTKHDRIDFDPTYTAPVTGKGSLYAGACAADSSAWTKARDEWQTGNTELFQSLNIKYAWTTVTTMTSTKEWLGPLTTACGGSVNYGASISTWKVYPLTTSFLQPMDDAGSRRWDAGYASFVSRQPPCSIGISDCYGQWSSWETARKTEFHSGLYPDCYLVPPNDCNQCTISANSAKVLYFHTPASVERDMCATMPTSGASYFTLPPNATATGYTVLQGTTLFEDQIYLSFDRIGANYPDCQDARFLGPRIGPVKSNVIIGIASSALSSVRYPWFDRGYEYNVADMIQPVPLSAHYGEIDCFWGLCDPISASYSPTLVVPTQIRDLHPLWKNCATQLWGVLDPPSAVTTIGVLTKPAQEWKTTSPSNAAQPSAAPEPAWPSKTALPVQIQQASTPAPAPGASRIQDYPQEPTATIIAVVGSTTVTADKDGKVIFGPYTLHNGGPPATISGTILSLGSAGIIISDTHGKNTVVLSPAASLPTLPPTAIFSVNGQPVTASQGPHGIIIDGAVLPEDGRAVTIHGNLVRPAQAGLNIGGTSFVQWFSFQAQTSTVGASISVGAGAAITAVGRGSDGHTIVVDGNTISIGGPPCTVNGKVYSAAPGGLVVDGISTVPLSILPKPTSAFKVLNINGHSLTMFSIGSALNTIVIGSATLSLGGPPVTVDGQKLSLGAKGLVVDDSTTIPIAQSTSGSVLSVNSTSKHTIGIGDYIDGGLGGYSTSSNIPVHSTGIGDYVQAGLGGTPVRKSPVTGSAKNTAHGLHIYFLPYLVICAVPLIST